MFVFLHGGVQGSWVWGPTIAALKLQDPSTECLLLDAPGCGVKRSRNTDGIAFEDIVADLVGDVEAAEISGATLVGHSQAGSVLPRMVELAPHRFGQLIYLACVAPEPEHTVLVGTAGREMADVPEEQRELPMERLRRMFCNDMDDRQAERFMASLGKDGWPRSSYAETQWRYDHLADIPSTYIMCLRDATLSLDLQHEFAQRLHAKRVLSLDSGHQAMTTRPHALAEMLLAEAAARGSQ